MWLRPPTPAEHDLGRNGSLSPEGLPCRLSVTRYLEWLDVASWNTSSQPWGRGRGRRKEEGKRSGKRKEEDGEWEREKDSEMEREKGKKRSERKKGKSGGRKRKKSKEKRRESKKESGNGGKREGRRKKGEKEK